MAMALLLALLMPLAQDDPQVTYREGLFEEVDQGNLDKAAELYAKVLKSDAPDALKAKALLRTGFCHEKKGKKKEAEQAWRDVVERYPGATETAKLARERLSSLTQEGSVSASLESQIQSLVLDLTSEEFNEKNGSVRKLIAIGQPAVPELRKAMLNRSQDLRSTAAYVLVQIGAFEGVYDGLKPLWIDSGKMGSWAYHALAETLKAREEDRRQFLKDVKPPVLAQLFHHLYHTLGSSSDPALAKLAEDHLIEADHFVTDYFRPLTANRDVSEIRRLAKRLAASKLQPNAKVREMLRSRAQAGKKGIEATPTDPELKQALLTALTGDSDPDALLHAISFEKRQFFHYWMFEYVTPREFVRGPIAKWILHGPDEFRSRILYMIQSTVGQPPHSTTEFAKELRAFQFDFMNAPEHPLELRRRVFVSASFPESPDLQKKFLQFCLQSLKEEEADPDEENNRKSIATYWLMLHLPLDSKELTETLEIAARGGWLSNDAMQERKGIREPAIAAVLRVIQDPKLPEARRMALLSFLASSATPQEKASLATVLPLVGPETAADAVNLYHEGILELPEVGREAAWTAYAGAFEASPDHVKAPLAELLIGSEGNHVLEVMNKASESSHAGVRRAALRHWTEAPQYSLKARTPLLLKGLKDTVEENQLLAINGLMLNPDLDAVPDIIESLNSAYANVRAVARKALEEIKKHYEDQAEWKRWYDETKKALKR